MFVLDVEKDIQKTAHYQLYPLPGIHYAIFHALE
jgi:hypothetical protein